MHHDQPCEQMMMNASDFFHFSESKVSVTKAAEDFVPWLRTERGIITQVEVFFVLSVLLHAVQVIFGWWRRCSSSAYIKHSLWLAYTIKPPLLIYTLGLARSSPSVAASELLRACAFPFVMALGSTNYMTAYSVDDNKQYTRRSVQQLLCVLSLVAMWKIDVSKLTDFRSIMTLIYSVAVYFMVALMISMNGGRIYASMAANSSLDKESRNVQVHMKSEHMESTNYDPVTLAGYGYLVCEKIDDSPSTRTGRQIEITVDRIWSCDEGPLATSDGKMLKEVCLSFALFRLMRRRFFGLSCPESKLQKTRDLVLKGLLLDYDVAYRVIEAELAFAHDHFFTGATFGNSELGKSTILLGTAKAVIYPVAILASVKDFYIHRENKSNTSSGIALTAVLIMLVLLALELLQVYLYLSSDWAKVQLVRRSISGKDITFVFDTFYCKLPKIFGYWQNKIGQHALLKDLHRRSYIANTIGSIFGPFCAEHLGYQTVSSRSTDLPGPKHVQLARDVKLAIARTLKVSNGHLSNGAFSLQRNAQCGLLWACQQENHTSTMLIWHIATEYCDVARSCERKEQDDVSVPNHVIATTLSNYCAYLIAFAPELLPDEELDTRIIFEVVRCDAQNIFSKQMALQEMYGMMTSCNVQPSDERILIKGILLGRQLQEIEHEVLWKILADFWTEMILYIAPSHNAKVHIEHLANGGEFLTHLWALLLHAGILQREQHSFDENEENIVTVKVELHL
ncbi:unnamed protein product [Urochloa decumbens]|uniref:DUF4220 domain-containing protein n=1 Tax=Urochloa decumbens TaxID=240449 RepID=A0ABC9FLN7_9POAL